MPFHVVEKTKKRSRAVFPKNEGGKYDPNVPGLYCLKSTKAARVEFNRFYDETDRTYCVCAVSGSSVRMHLFEPDITPSVGDWERAEVGLSALLKVKPKLNKAEIPSEEEMDELLL